MPHKRGKLTAIANVLSWIYVLERVIKMAAVVHFFRKPRPADPVVWPSVTLLQPITKGASDLRAALDARTQLDYPARIRHLLLCDAADGESQSVCKDWTVRNSTLDAQIVPVVAPASPSGIAPKTSKLQAGMLYAECDIVCCVDDDIILRPDALRTMLPYLGEAGAGATFGVACYTDWSNIPSSLMSGFVNTNALLTYIPGTYLTEPFTLTGHIFAIRRSILLALGSFDGMENNVGDDHILAQKVKSAGLRIVQTPMIYDVENHFPTLASYAGQIKRWFVFPRQMLVPVMTAKEQAATFAVSGGNLIPGILLLLALFSRNRTVFRSLARSMVAFNVAYSLCERLYLKRVTPMSRRPIVSLVALLAPAQVVGALLSSNEIEWRGMRLRIEVGGNFTDVSSKTR